VAVAKADLTQATLTSPLAGTVAAVAIAVGDSVSASSTSQTITVIGPANYQVSTTAALSVVDKITVGQPATVTVDGVGEPLNGTVSVIGVLKSSSAASTSYPVTIALRNTGTTLYNGAGAAVAITVGRVERVLTVPSSAVSTTGAQSTVTVLANGVTTVTPVTVGAIGNDLTQILGGVTAGQQVVIADLGAPLPTATTTAGAGQGGIGALGGTGGRVAGFGGAGLGGAGAGGGIRGGG